jgi:ubiquinol-cytochrome c reductase cytochrome c subunit
VRTDDDDQGEVMTASPPAARSGRPRARARALAAWARKPRSAQSRLRRRLSSGARMIAALFIVGAFYTAFAPGAAAQDQPTLSADASAGKLLYDDSCISCHGLNAQGVQGRGPSLIGVGSASVEFQVSTGRMPAAAQSAQIERKTPVFTLAQSQQIGAYIQALGGGPQIPDGNLRSTDVDGIANGGALFRVNCASCHSFGEGGGALSSGKFAPSLDQSTDREIYAAMLSGPQNMPVFGDNQLNPDEKRDIIGYIQNMKADQDPGGLGIGHLGPTTEGLVIFLVGMVGLIFATLWIAGKS